MVLVYTFMVLVLISISLLMVRGISNMNDNHPNYNGDDLFNESDINEGKL